MDAVKLLGQLCTVSGSQYKYLSEMLVLALLIPGLKIIRLFIKASREAQGFLSLSASIHKNEV